MKKNYFTPLLLRFKSLVSLALVSLFLSLIIVSCSKLQDNFDFSKVVVPDWNPEFAIPLVNSTFALSDFFGNSEIEYIQINADSSLSLIYNSMEIFSQRIEDIVNIPSQSFNFQSQFDLIPFPVGDSLTISLEFPIHIMAGDTNQHLDSLVLKGGTLHIAGQTNLNKDFAGLKVKIPEIIHKTTNQPLALNISLNNPNGLANFNYDVNVPIGEYKFIFDNSSNSSKNQLTLQCSLTIHGDDNPDQSPYNFSINGSFNNLDFKYLFGYLGTFDISITDSIAISLFDKTIGGGIDIGPHAVDLVIDVSNQIGMPIKFGTDNFYATSDVNTPNRVDIYFNSDEGINSFIVEGPDITQVGETIETRLDFGDNNFSDAFNIAPENLYYKFAGQTNPDADTLASNFVIDTSRVSVRVGLEFQLFTSISRYVIEDTLDFSLDEVKEVDHLLFRINTTNGFPLDAKVQVYFADNDYLILDSLITDPNQSILPGASVSGPDEYRVIEPAVQMTDINLTSTRIKNMQNAKFMILKAGLMTTNEQLIKIYNDYSLQIKIGTIAGIIIKNN